MSGAGGTERAARKGVLLAGGRGTRLRPTTRVVSKQLVPVYDKPLIYYPLTTLMMAGIREILVITTPDDQPLFRRLLGDGSRWGLRLAYAVQPKPEGVAQALVIARDFLDGAPSALILGDNVFYGDGLGRVLRRAARRRDGATVLAQWVSEPERYGVVTLDDDGEPTSLVEKPERPDSHYAVTGLYFYDGRAPDFAADLEPSDRGELEITDVNRRYLEAGELAVERLGRGYTWIDAGTFDALLTAANLVQTVERRQGLRIAVPEEVAWRQGWIDDEELARLAEPLESSGYGRYLLGLLEQEAPRRGEAGRA